MALSQALPSVVALAQHKFVSINVARSFNLQSSRSPSLKNKLISKSGAASCQPSVVETKLPENQYLQNFRPTLLDNDQKGKLMEVKHLLRKLAISKDSMEILVMVDAIQRLAIDYYFKDEIQSVLHDQHSLTFPDNKASNNSLFEVSLRFRLLRQAGYNVSTDMFKSFKGKDGGFDELKMCNDLLGLASLYEASHLSTVEDDILFEASEFCARALLSMLRTNNLDHHESELVRSTLENPIHKSLARFTSSSFKRYFKMAPYKWTKTLEELAEMESYRVRSINQMEIHQISKWWEDVGLSRELKFARDEPLKWYLWPMTILEDAEQYEERVELTKPISLIYIIDDIFDVYGTPDELTLFTEAVNRWECIEELPNYMRTCFQALHRITDEISCNVYRKHGWDPTNLLRKSWARLCNAFLVEAKWFTLGQMPRTEEYLKNAIVSSGVHLTMVHAYAILGECVDQKSLDRLNGFPELLSSTAKIFRLWDDLGSAKDENQDGKDGSYVEYYMNENPSSSMNGARDHVNTMISEAWKSLNKECLFPYPFSVSFAKVSLNMARMVPLMYDYDSNCDLPRLNEFLEDLLLHNV